MTLILSKHHRQSGKDEKREKPVEIVARDNNTNPDTSSTSIAVPYDQKQISKGEKGPSKPKNTDTSSRSISDSRKPEKTTKDDRKQVASQGDLKQPEKPSREVHHIAEELKHRLQEPEPPNKEDRHSSEQAKKVHHLREKPQLHLPKIEERLLRDDQSSDSGSPISLASAASSPTSTLSSPTSTIPYDLISPISRKSETRRKAKSEIPDDSSASSYSSNTDESDKEADDLLRTADSGPAPVHGDLHSAGEKAGMVGGGKGKERSPEEMVERAEEVLMVSPRRDKRTPGV